MSIAENIVDFLRGGIKAVLKDEEKHKPVVINITQGGGGVGYPPVVAPVSQPGLYALPHQLLVESAFVSFDVTFEPVDKTTREYLNANQPVVILIFDQHEAEEAIVEVTDLGQGISGELYPGSYGVIVLVYIDEDFEEIDGLGFSDFSIQEGEPPFELVVPVTADEEEIAEFFGLQTEDSATHIAEWDLENMDEEQFYNLRQAAEDGDSEAEFQLGQMYITGRYFSGFFVEQDKEQGYQWLALAARQGDSRAKAYLRKRGLI